MGLLNKKKSRQSRGDAQPARRRRNAELASQSVTSSTFKSGRTLPGTTYARLKNTERQAVKTATPREKMHHLANVRKKLAWVFAGFVALTIFLLAILWQLTASVVIQPIQISVPQNDLNDYAKSIQKYLSDNPVERLRFNLNSQNLNKLILATHPEVKSVTQIGSAGFTATTFNVELRKPVVSWQVEDAKYFVDSDGVSFSKNLYPNPEVTIVDNSGVQYTPGTAIASSRFLSFVGRAVSKLQDRGLVVSTVVIPAGTSRQAEISVKDVAYPFIMSIDRSPTDQAEDASRIIAHFRTTGVTPKYVDLRVHGRAFYRE